MKTLCGWAVGLAHVPQSGLPDLIRTARTDARTPLGRRAPRHPLMPAPQGRPRHPWLRPPAPESAAACRGGVFQARLGPCVPWKPADIDPGRTASRHGPSEPRSSPARARGRLRRPASLPRVPRSRTGPSVWPGREPRRTDGRCPAPSAPRPAAASRCRGGLRGAAAYEAEGRCGARGGGAGRVGPPTGWHRLRLLRQIRDQLVPGVEQFLLVDNVVAVEDGAALSD